MKLFWLTITLFFLTACNMHDSQSTVLEQEKLQKAKLQPIERIQKAYLEKDYGFLENAFKAGTPVDVAMPSGKTLLFMSVESQFFKMADFLMGHGANPDSPVKVEDRKTTALEVAQKIIEEKDRHAMTELLTGRLAQVSHYLFFKNIFNLTAGENLDIDWLTRLLENGVQLSQLSEKDFTKAFIKKVPVAKNSKDVLNLLFQDHTLLPLENWKLFVEKPFVKGRYKRAKCTFVEHNSCFTFSEMNQTCQKRYRKQLSRAKSKLINYVTIRNRILACDPEYLLL